MRKFIKISIFIFIAIFLILVGAWLINRQQAIKSGQTPLTFREFLNLSAGREQKPGVGGTGNLSSDFGNQNNNNSGSSGTNNNTTGGNSGNNEDGTRVSDFTDDTQIPIKDGTDGEPIDIDGDGVPDGIDTNGDGVIDGIDTSGDGIIDEWLIDTNGDGVIDGIDTNGDGTIDGEYISEDDTTNEDGTIPGDPAEECSDRDLNIEFTPEEISKLQELQARFYSVAQYVHNDGDVDAEKGNWSTFKTEGNDITELYNYCQDIAYKITNPLFKYRIPTPFWHDPTRDNVTILPPKLSNLTIGAHLNSDDFYVNGDGVILGAKEDLYLDQNDPTVLLEQANGEATGNSSEIDLNAMNKIFNATNADDRAHKLEQTLRVNLW